MKILLCDDHELILTGLCNLLEGQDYIHSVVGVKNGVDALEKIRENSFDLIISDVSMPEMDGIALSEKVMSLLPKQKIIILTQFTDMQVLKPLLKNQVDGIVLKGGSNDEILQAVQKVIGGEKFYSTTIIHIIAACFAGGESSAIKTLIKLSKREQQVLELIAEEKTNKEISEQLYISIPTVETYRRNLFKKFDVKNSAGLIRKAMRMGFIA